MDEMTPEPEQNGRKARVKFGKRSTQTIAHEDAEWMLCQWKEEDEKRFGEMLRRAMMRDA